MKQFFQLRGWQRTKCQDLEASQPLDQEIQTFHTNNRIFLWWPGSPHLDQDLQRDLMMRLSKVYQIWKVTFNSWYDDVKDLDTNDMKIMHIHNQ